MFTYITLNDGTEVQGNMKDLDTEFTPMWKSCKALIGKFPKKKWKDLVKHVLAFGECE